MAKAAFAYGALSAAGDGKGVIAGVMSREPEGELDAIFDSMSWACPDEGTEEMMGVRAAE